MTTVGAMVTSVSTNFEKMVLHNGQEKIFFSFQVAVAPSENIGSDGTPLAVNIYKEITTVLGIRQEMVLSEFKVSRLGGEGKFLALGNDGYPIPDLVDGENNQVAINFKKTYDQSNDRKIKPGSIGEYILTATIIGTDALDQIQTLINNVGENFFYTHDKGLLGMSIGETNEFCLEEVYDVIGGTLSN